MARHNAAISKAIVREDLLRHISGLSSHFVGLIQPEGGVFVHVKQMYVNIP